ncbi:TPA: elongation factor P maturation arginine rhamnosyltransferase EarP [Candidatus Azambacteria bacterium]|nr:elongation factor P maturation arginine rhamnosyltransferase EarP [Rheinheimera sp.]HAW92140.1 elongation factor P maturation arginine rhamnosyltransferase EarP [Candidatus Azambacteria bacterium]
MAVSAYRTGYNRTITILNQLAGRALQHSNQSAPGGIWRIFCSVVDNFGDIGICWRISRQLVAEHGLRVQLWVDDLTSFQRICPQIKPELARQSVLGVEICYWPPATEFAVDWQQLAPATVVVEALACTIPVAYKQHMASQQPPPLWINLEYLSAESWVEGCHGLNSPQPDLAVHKYFFFPGFTELTGGLLYEQGLVQQLSSFNASDQAQTEFWQQIGIDHTDFQLKVSMFAYSHVHIYELLQQWQQHPAKVLCVIPHGDLATELAAQYPELLSGNVVQFDNLSLKVIPFLAQPDYDLLLAVCDVNFVRGEDSIIRAHWAGKPFVWQIYRQQENTHLLKLQAFLDRYCRQMPEQLSKPVQQFYLAWNTHSNLTLNWQQFYPLLSEIAEYNQQWRQQLLANGDLASNLVHFAKKKFIITPNFSQQ